MVACRHRCTDRHRIGMPGRIRDAAEKRTGESYKLRRCISRVACRDMEFVIIFICACMYLRTGLYWPLPRIIALCGLQYSLTLLFRSVCRAGGASSCHFYPIIDRANSVSGLDHWRRHKTRHTADATGSVIIIQNHAARSLLLSVNCARCLRQFIIVELMHRKSFALEHEPPPMRLSSARLKLSGGKFYTLFLCRHCSSCSIISCCHATARGLISLLQCFRSVPRCQTCSRCSKAQ